MGLFLRLDNTTSHGSATLPGHRSVLTRVVQRGEEAIVPAKVAQEPDHVHLRLFAVVGRAGTAGVQQRRRAASKEDKDEAQGHKEAVRSHSD